MRLRSSLDSHSAVPAVAGAVWSATAAFAVVAMMRLAIGAGTSWIAPWSAAIPTILLWIGTLTGVWSIRRGAPDPAVPLSDQGRVWPLRVRRWPMMAIAVAPPLILATAASSDPMIRLAMLGQAIVALGILGTIRSPAGFVPLSADSAARLRTDATMRRLASGLTVHSPSAATVEASADDELPVAVGEPIAAPRVPETQRESAFGSKFPLGVFNPCDQGLDEPPAADDPDLLDESHVTQRLTRVAEPDGVERIEGTLLLSFAAGQKLAYAHVPFVPAFAEAPAVECEPLDGDGTVRVRAAAAHPFGVRIEGRRNAADEEVAVPVAFEAAGRVRTAV